MAAEITRPPDAMVADRQRTNDKTLRHQFGNVAGLGGHPWRGLVPGRVDRLGFRGTASSINLTAESALRLDQSFRYVPTPVQNTDDIQSVRSNIVFQIDIVFAKGMTAEAVA